MKEMLAEPKQKNSHGQKLHERQCVACGVKQDRLSFIRILRNAHGNYIVNPSSKEFGRSYYLCPDEKCLTKTTKHNKYKNKFDFHILEEIILK